MPKMSQKDLSQLVKHFSQSLSLHHVELYGSGPRDWRAKANWYRSKSGYFVSWSSVPREAPFASAAIGELSIQSFTPLSHPDKCPHLRRMRTHNI
jgi:hypothetical protein